jgi:hypothetical protein
MSTYTKTLKFLLVTNVGDEIPVDVEADFFYRPPQQQTSNQEEIEERAILQDATLEGIRVIRWMDRDYIRNIEEEEAMCRREPVKSCRAHLQKGMGGKLLQR